MLPILFQAGKSLFLKFFNAFFHILPDTFLPASIDLVFKKTRNHINMRFISVNALECHFLYSLFQC